jgi:hypothetical protein
MKHPLLPLLAAGALALPAAAPQAAVVTSLSPGQPLNLPALDYIGPGPVALSPLVTWSSNVDWAVLGYTDVYQFGTNGDWSGTPMAGLNNDGPLDLMRFSFATPVAGFGGLLNYVPGTGTARVAAYDAANTLLEQFDLDFATGGVADSGRFYGFRYDSSVISSVTLQGAFIGGARFSVLAAPLPEPGGLALLALGLCTAVFVQGRAAGRRPARP